MKAILYTKYGPPEVLQLKEVEKPTPKDHQVLVKVHAASVNALDWRPFTMPSLLIRLMSGGGSKPKDPSIGADVAGTVEAVGRDVTEFQPGDKVFGMAPGSFAEYVANGASKFAHKPANVSFAAAAAVPVAAFTALQGLRDKGKIKPGQKVLIDGASGGVGIYAVQIAKAFGAEVTAVCSTRNLDMVRSIGADHVIDYRREDFTKNGQRYDLILAVNGYHPILNYRRALSSNGICVVAGGSFSQILQAMLLGPFVSRFGNRKVGFMGMAKTPKEDLLSIKELLEAGKVVPVIDKSYPLSETAQAIRHLIEEHGRGKVVIVVDSGSGLRLRMTQHTRETIMKAIIWTKYGSADGLQLREVEKPTPNDNEVLIKIHAATAATPDTEFRKLKLPPLFVIPLRLYIGFIRPTRITILGTEFSGEIELAGKDVTGYKPGDQVFGYTGLKMGTYAEYICLTESSSIFAGVFAKKPVNMSYEEAAAVPFGGLEALHSLEMADIRPGQKVLIVGAGGSIGTWTVQLAKHYGAEVTGVDHTSKFDMLRSIGADHVIDYTRDDFTKNGSTYDVILDTFAKSPFWGSVRSLNENGIYVNANPSLLDRIWMGAALKNSNKKVLTWTGGYSTKNLLALKELIEDGKLKSVIDRTYPLEQIVEAHRYVDSGLKKGNVVITVQ